MSDPIVFETATSRFVLPLLFAGQAQKEFFVNEALVRTDLLLHATIEGETAAPPVSPEVGQTWIVAASPTGLFEGHAHCLAGWTADGWRFVTPLDGLRVFDKENAAFRLYRDNWQRQIVPHSPSGGTTIDTEARAIIGMLLEKLVDAGVFATS
jgi:hypothetical protein